MPDSSFVRYLVESKVKMFVHPKGGVRGDPDYVGV
jgi:hypothetical protein